MITSVGFVDGAFHADSHNWPMSKVLYIYISYDGKPNAILFGVQDSVLKNNRVVFNLNLNEGIDLQVIIIIFLFIYKILSWILGSNQFQCKQGKLMSYNCEILR